MEIILIFVGVTIVKLIIFGFVLYKVAWPEWRGQKVRPALPGIPCIYCQASPAEQKAEERHWEGDELVLVSSYQCRSCHLPFWHVERVSATHAQKL